MYMATGDNALTAMWVGQKWGILNSDEYFIADLADVNNRKCIVWKNEYRKNILGHSFRGELPGNDNNFEHDYVSVDTTEHVQPSDLLSQYVPQIFIQLLI